MMLNHSSNGERLCSEIGKREGTSSGSPSIAQARKFDIKEQSKCGLKEYCLDENETKLTKDVILLKKETSNSKTFDDDTESDTESFFSPTNTVKEDEAEINRIKVMLHHKELELSQLKEQIEKNKNTLSKLQTKAETEINKAQKLVLDKDVELLAVEESLSGLKQFYLMELKLVLTLLFMNSDEILNSVGEIQR
ncbi:hypothetical protein LXL04_018054 [Taraxacum kok-saghyz]